jgi:hypothetical protein
MAVSNNLQWLENARGVNIPHPHRLGLRRDGSLVGELDFWMGRFAPSRVRGGGVGNDQALFGKLSYVSANQLSNRLILEHQYPSHPVWRQLQQNQAISLAANHARGTAFSTWRGEPSADFIIAATCQNASVDLAYFSTAPVYGHVVQVVRAGKVRGVPYVFHLSDLVQANEPGGDQRGTGMPQFSYLVDNADNDRVPNLVNTMGMPNALLVMKATVRP